MIVLVASSYELVKVFLPATVAAELKFDSVSPPPDTIEEEDEG